MAPPYAHGYSAGVMYVTQGISRVQGEGVIREAQHDTHR